MADFWKKYILSLTSGILTLLALIFFNRITIWWLFLVVLLLWLGGLTGILFLRNNDKTNFKNSIQLLLVTAISFLGLLLILETIWIKFLIGLILIGMIVFLIFHSPKKSELSYLDKPVRRFIGMLWVMNLFCLVSIFYAINLFFQNVPFWLLGFLLSLITAWISVNIWKNYFAISYKSFLFWFILITLISWEISWVLHFLPFGYLVLGFLFVWVWYIINLLVRFHLTSQGIVWKKQVVFLISNIILYCLVLFFFVRWI